MFSLSFPMHPLQTWSMPRKRWTTLEAVPSDPWSKTTSRSAMSCVRDFERFLTTWGQRPKVTLKRRILSLQTIPPAVAFVLTHMPMWPPTRHLWPSRQGFGESGGFLELWLEVPRSHSIVFSWLEPCSVRKKVPVWEFRGVRKRHEGSASEPQRLQTLQRVWGCDIKDDKPLVSTDRDKVQGCALVRQAFEKRMPCPRGVGNSPPSVPQEARRQAGEGPTFRVWVQIVRGHRAKTEQRPLAPCHSQNRTDQGSQQRQIGSGGGAKRSSTPRSHERPSIAVRERKTPEQVVHESVTVAGSVAFCWRWRRGGDVHWSWRVQGTETSRRSASSSSDQGHEGFHREGQEARCWWREHSFGSGCSDAMDDHDMRKVFLAEQ